MNDRILNQIDMTRRCFECLDKPAHSPLWNGVSPVIFTAKVAAARTLQGQILASGAFQELDTRGTTEDKAREEKELEDAAYELGSALVACCTDAGDLTGGAPFRLTLTKWRKLRGEQLLQKASQLLTALANAIQSQPLNAAQCRSMPLNAAQCRSMPLNAAQCRSMPLNAAQYGIDTASYSRLQLEIATYSAHIAKPAAAIDARSAVTEALPDQVNELLEQFDVLDTLIVQFRRTPAGVAFVSEWFRARVINDRGHGPAPEPGPPPLPECAAFPGQSISSRGPDTRRIAKPLTFLPKTPVCSFPSPLRAAFTGGGASSKTCKLYSGSTQ